MFAALLLGQRERAQAELDTIAVSYDAEILILWRRIHLATQDGDHAATEAMAVRMAGLADDERWRPSTWWKMGCR
jgi:hypothetical protein